MNDRNDQASPVRRLIPAAVLICLLAALTTACSSDDDAGGETSVDRGATVDAIVANATAQDIDVDQACVTTVVDKFSEADLAVLALSPTDPDVAAMSIPGQGLVVEILDCTGGRPGGTIPSGDLTTTKVLLLDQIIATLDAQGATYNENCLHDLVAAADTALLSNSAYAQDLVGQATTCITG